MNEGKCIHLNGAITNDCCRAGVNYEEAFGKEDGIFLRMPCIQFCIKPAHGRGTYVKPGEPTIREEVDRHGQAMIPCSLLQLPTDVQVLADRIEFEAHLAKFTKVMKVVAVWRKKPPKGKSEIIECPACAGRLHLSQASYNGHVHGRCETTGCVNWME